MRLRDHKMVAFYELIFFGDARIVVLSCCCEVVVFGGEMIGIWIERSTRFTSGQRLDFASTLKQSVLKGIETGNITSIWRPEDIFVSIIYLYFNFLFYILLCIIHLFCTCETIFKLHFLFTTGHFGWVLNFA